MPTSDQAVLPKSSLEVAGSRDREEVVVLQQYALLSPLGRDRPYERTRARVAVRNLSREFGSVTTISEGSWRRRLFVPYEELPDQLYDGFAVEVEMISAGDTVSVSVWRQVSSRAMIVSFYRDE